MNIPLVDQVLALVRRSGRETAPRKLGRDDRVRNAFTQAPVGIAFASPDGHWLFVNDRFRDIVGYTREELARVSLHGITHPDDAKKELPLMKKLVAGDIESYRLDKKLMAKNGRYQNVEVLTSLMRGGDGEVDLLVYIVDQAEAPKRSEPARETDRLLATIVDQLTDVAIIRTDEHGVINGWNAGAERVLGYTRTEILGRNRRILYRDTDSWDRRSTKTLQAASDSRVEMDDWRVTKGGAHIWARCVVTPVKADGELKGFVETITPPQVPKGVDTALAMEQLRAELEKRKRTEESLRSALDDLRRTSEETMNELRIMTGALRDEIERRKSAEDELRHVSERLAAVPEPAPEPPPVYEEEIVLEAAPELTWQNVAETTMAEVLRAQALIERTGTLLVSNGPRDKEVFFDAGRIFSCASNDPDKFLAQRLVAHGVISEDQRERALEIKQASQLALGRILLLLGAIDETQLIDAMRTKVEDEIAELLTWKEGRYVFVEGDVPSLQLVPLRLDVETLIAPKPLREAEPEPAPQLELALELPVSAPEPEAAPEPAPVAVADVAPPAAPPPALFVASTKSRKVHQATCTSAKRITGAARVELASTEGYERCRLCFR
ncbi:MAG: PAS domain S-box protein [Acidobacteria bacterium]|nr:PAS domain S-box protein [Acidobacteriota bacterium]MBV9478557.1 PAS domain S-box protein [Acidobacteriota bacterium]